MRPVESAGAFFHFPDEGDVALDPLEALGRSTLRLSTGGVSPEPQRREGRLNRIGRVKVPPVLSGGDW